MLSPDSWWAPATAGEYDALTYTPLPLRLRIDVPFDAGAAWVACDLDAPSALTPMVVGDVPIAGAAGFHIVFRRINGRASLERAARRNALALRTVAFVPADIATHQERLARRIADAPFVVEQYCLAENPDAAAACTSALLRAFRVRFGRAFEAPAFEFERDGHADALTTPSLLSLADPITAREAAAGARTESALSDLLLLEADAVGAAGPDLDHDTRSVEAMDSPLPDPGPRYAVASYARVDADRVEPLLAEMQAAGWTIWYDREIPAGVEWDAIVERRIIGSVAVLLFVSRASMASRYVRREVKLADVVGRPIVPVHLEPVVPRDGLRMLLTPLQFEEYHRPGLVERLVAALDRAAESR